MLLLYSIFLLTSNPGNLSDFTFNKLFVLWKCTSSSALLRLKTASSFDMLTVCSISNCLNKTNSSPRLDFVKRFRAVHAYFMIVLNVLSLVHGDAKHQRPRRVQGYQLTVMVSKESARFARACVISPWNKTNTGNNGGKRKLLSLLLNRHQRRREKAKYLSNLTKRHMTHVYFYTIPGNHSMRYEGGDKFNYHS